MKKKFLVLLIAIAAITCTAVAALCLTACSEKDVLEFERHGDGYMVSNVVDVNTPEIIIPSTYKGKPVTAISALAFSRCEALTTVTIPDSVTSIGDNAFEYCESLTSIILPDGITFIGDTMFSYCNSLTTVTIPDSVTYIGDSVFGYCKILTSIKFNGTTAQWNAIDKDRDWDDYSSNFTVQCTNGKLDKDGNVIE